MSSPLAFFGVLLGGANLFALAASLRRSRVDLRSRIFDFAVPVLLFFAALSVLIRVPVPKASHEPRPRHLVPHIFASGIYSGYFGPGHNRLHGNRHDCNFHCEWSRSLAAGCPPVCGRGSWWLNRRHGQFPLPGIAPSLIPDHA